MDDREWGRVKEVFLRAIERPTGERSELIEEACGGDDDLRAKVEAFVNAHEQAGPDPSNSSIPLVAGGEGPGATIGRYKLLQKIGEGGFGTVYMAEQTEPVNRRVALKIVKLGMDTRQVIARFEAERQALALMDHPSIARVLDAGATDSGRPYFVMELVKGVPITEYCDQASLDTAERLALFQEVCHAVQHAHQKGIIHRDIKPTNVMVTLHDGRPVPKVIDFGIAKATDRKLTQKTLFTEFRQMVGTPEYMAPEQAEMSGLDVDTRADIYSLGVLLYELLTGTQPFDMKLLLAKGYDEILRTIREVDPPKPSTRISTLGEELSVVASRRHTPPKLLGRLLRGDLDWIVMKALAKDRSRRYKSAGAFVEDIGRYLSDRPVVAGPPGRAYRVRKYVRRHRVGVAAAAAVIVALVVGGVLTAMGYVEATKQRDLAQEARRESVQQADAAEEARRREAELREVAEAKETLAQTEGSKKDLALLLVGEMLLAPGPVAEGPDYTVRELLEDFERRVHEKQGVASPILLALLGGAYRRVGLLDRSENHLKRALEILRRDRGEDHAWTISAACEWSRLLKDRGRYAECVKLARHLVEIHSRSRPDDHRDRATLLADLADVLRIRGEFAEAERHARESLDIRRRLYGEWNRDVAFSQEVLASVLAHCGKADEAVDLVREALAYRIETLGEEHPEVCWARNSLAVALCKKGELDEAESLLRKNLTVDRRTRQGPRLLAWTLGNLASVLEEQGELEEASRTLRESIDLWRRLVGDEHPRVPTDIGRLARIRYKQRDLPAAEDLNREALELWRRIYGPEHRDVAITLASLAVLRREQGDHASAVAFYREAVAMKRKVLGEEHPDVANALNDLGATLSAIGRHREAAAAHREALRIRKLVHGPRHELVAVSLHNLGCVLAESGELAAAERHLNEALSLRRALLGDDHVDTASTLISLGLLLIEKPEFERAKAPLHEALAVLRRHPGEDGVQVQIGITLNGLGCLLGRKGELDEAEDLQRQSIESCRGAVGQDRRHLALALTNLARLEQKRGRLAESVRPQREAIEVSRSVLGDGHPDVAAAQEELAMLLVDLDRREEAEVLLREALAIRRKCPGDGQLDLANCLNVLGAVQQKLGKLDEAESHLTEALAVHREHGRETHPDMTATLNNLAFVHEDRDDLDGAEALLRRAISIWVKVGGQDQHLNRGRSSLASLLARKESALRAGGDPKSREALLREVLAIRRATHDGDHESIVVALFDLSDLLQEQGEPAAAEPLLREALVMARRLELPLLSLLGSLCNVLLCSGRLDEAEPLFREYLSLLTESETPDGCSLARCRLGLGLVLVARRDFAGAEPLLREALAGLRKHVGDESLITLQAISSYALCLFSRGSNDAGAEALTREHLAGIRKRLGNDHPLVADDLHQLGHLVQRRGDDEEVERLFREAHEIRTNIDANVDRDLLCYGAFLIRRGKAHDAEPVLRQLLARHRREGSTAPDQVLLVLGYCLMAQERYAEGESLLREALDLCRKGVVPASRHDGVLAMLGECLIDQGKHAEAEPILRKALDLRERGKPGSWLHYNAMSLLGGSLAGLGLYDKAKPLLLESYEKMKPPAGLAFKRVEALERIVSLYEAWGKLEKAATWRARLPEKR